MDFDFFLELQEFLNRAASEDVDKETMISDMRDAIATLEEELENDEEVDD